MKLRQQILAMASNFVREYQLIDIPQWPETKGKLFLRNLNALESERYVALIASDDPAVCVTAEVAVLVLVDADGQAVLTADDAKSLAAADPEPLEEVLQQFAEWRRSRIERRKKQYAGTPGSIGTTSPGTAASSTPTT